MPSEHRSCHQTSGQATLQYVPTCRGWAEGDRTCSELLEEPHAGTENLVGAAQVAQVRATQGQKQPQGGQVCLQGRLCQGSPDDQGACRDINQLIQKSRGGVIRGMTLKPYGYA